MVEMKHTSPENGKNSYYMPVYIEGTFGASRRRVKKAFKMRSIKSKNIQWHDGLVYANIVMDGSIGNIEVLRKRLDNLSTEYTIDFR